MECLVETAKKWIGGYECDEKCTERSDSSDVDETEVAGCRIDVFLVDVNREDGCSAVDERREGRDDGCDKGYESESLDTCRGEVVDKPRIGII